MRPHSYFLVSFLVSTQINTAKFSAFLVPCFMLQALAMDIYLPFLPQLEVHLSTTYQSVQWTLSIFMLATGIGQPLFGLFVDRFGDRTVLKSSLLLFFVSSVACALSQTVFMLILSRFFEGLGACGCMVSCLALCRNNLPLASLTKSCTVLNGTNGIAPLIAPILGAILLTIFGTWRSCFVSLVVFSALAILVTTRLPVGNHAAQMSFDPASVLKTYARIFRKPSFFIASFCGATAMTALFLFFSVSPTIIVKQLLFSEVHFSLFFALNAVFFLASSFASTQVQEWMGAVNCLKLGLSIVIVGAIFMLSAQVLLGVSIASFVVPNLIITSGVGLVLGTSAGLAMSQFADNAGMVAAAFGVLVYGFSGLLGLIVTAYDCDHAMAVAFTMMVLGMLGLVAVTGQIWADDK